MSKIRICQKIVSVRTPENLGKASATVTQDDINRFISKFYSYMVENGFEDVLSRPDALFNLDETSFDLNQVPRKVLAKKGRRRKFNYGVVNSREILTKLKEDEEAKQKIQQEKDERKALREEKKLLKNISLKIKKEEKDIDGLVSDEPIPKKSRDRPKKNILYQ
ncbi:hypothetical protein PVAND_004460 [Polypedilum vanderplanki]|uniref:Uncharacterized protein n=1 Tax=Polypedilum vanderplanki TaxID=319348 RepID=A0A9J6BXM7_POLVA|nr:hypothetical protein PVAND_004460 [Polypedilum vanderplanki]